MPKYERPNLLTSLDSAKASARVRGDEVRSRRDPAAPGHGSGSDVQARAGVQSNRRNSERPQPPCTGRVVSDGSARGDRGRAGAYSRPSKDSLARRSFVPIVLVLVVVVAFLYVLLSVRNCSSGEQSQNVDVQPRYTSPFDWTCLERDNGRWSYVVGGQVKSRLGIDVSENQGEIDWRSVADDGIEFAIVRVGYRGSTEGDLYADAHYLDNLDGAHEAGLDCGAYFFSQAANEDEAVEEAEFVLALLDGRALEYPVTFDSEEVAPGVGKSRAAGLPREQIAAIANAFCARIEEAGYASSIYGNAYDLSRYGVSNLQGKSVWWAEYGSPSPLHSVDIDMWQYSNNGQVAGISTVVDMNMDLSHALD